MIKEEILEEGGFGGQVAQINGRRRDRYYVNL